MTLENIRDIGMEAHEQELKTIERHFNSLLLSRLRAGRGLPYDPTVVVRKQNMGMFPTFKTQKSGYKRALDQYIFKVYRYKKQLE